MKYKNPYYKKTKKAFTMAISCNFCGKDLFIYRKKGKGALLRIWLERIEEMSFDLDPRKNLACPFCGKDLADQVEKDGQIFFKTKRSALGTRRVD